MKKILLATTILGLSAGYAAADISWSASAAAGVASAPGEGSEGSMGEFVTYSSMKIGVKGSAETDGGLTFSSAMDTTRGTVYNTGGDLGDGFEYKSGSFGMPTISIGGAFGTVTFSDDNIDFFDDHHGGGDVKYVGTFGAITLGAVSDIDDGDYSVQLGYSADGLAVSMDTEVDSTTFPSYDTNNNPIMVDEANSYNASVAYTVGAITGKISTSESEVTVVKLSYAADAISASVELDDEDFYTVTAGYSANGLTIGVETDSGEYTKVTGSYDLGNGLSLQAGADSNEYSYLGAAMKF